MNECVESAGAVTALFTHFNPEEPGNSGNPEYSSKTSAAVSITGAGDPRDVDLDSGPILVLHGTNDDIVPFPLGLQICAASTALSTSICELEPFAGEGHDLRRFSSGIADRTAEFLYRHVKKCCDDVLGLCL